MKKILVIILFIMMGIIVYSPSFHAPFQFDDLPRIVNNPIIENLKNIKAIWLYEPSRVLAYLSFAINYQFNQLNPFGYHLVNIFLHLLTTVIYFILLKLFFAKLETNGRNEHHDGKIVLFASLIFLCHPIQTSAVTYVVQRSTLLASLFYLSAVLFYVYYRLLKEKRLYVFSIFFFVLGLFSKPISLSLPLAILLIDKCFFTRVDQKDNKTLKRIIPYAVVSILFLLLLTLCQYRALSFESLANMSKETIIIPRWQYLLTQFNVVITYWRLFFFPINLHLDYEYPLVTSFLNPQMLVSLALIVLILYLSYRLFQKERMMAFAILWIFVTLIPESSFFPIADVIFEHRMYLPMVGFAILIPALLRRMIKEFKVYQAVMWLIIVIFAVLAYQRNCVWADKMKFLEDMARHAPNKPRVLYHLAYGYDEIGKKDLAIDIFNQVINQNPDDAQAYHNRGFFYLLNDKLDLALADFNKAIDFAPNFIKAHYNRGQVYQKKEQYDLALNDYQFALDLMPSYVDVYNNRGNIYKKLGKYDLALNDYQKSLEFNSRNAEVLNNRGVIYLVTNQFREALNDFNQALSLKPGFAEGYLNRGGLFIKAGQYELALKDYTNGILLNASNKEAYFNRGGIYIVQGQLDFAITDYNKVIELDPSDDRAYNARGTAYQQKREFDLALKDFNQAITLNPKNYFAYYNRAQLYQLQNNLPMVLQDLLTIKSLGYSVDEKHIEELKKALR